MGSGPDPVPVDGLLGVVDLLAYVLIGEKRARHEVDLMDPLAEQLGVRWDALPEFFERSTFDHLAVGLRAHLQGSPGLVLALPLPTAARNVIGQFDRGQLFAAAEFLGLGSEPVGGRKPGTHHPKHVTYRRFEDHVVDHLAERLADMLSELCGRWALDGRIDRGRRLQHELADRLRSSGQVISTKKPPGEAA